MTSVQWLYGVGYCLLALSACLISVIYAEFCLQDEGTFSGLYLNNSAFATLVHSTLFSCAAACYSYSICRSFNFEKSNKSCFLNMDKDTSSPGYMVVSSDFIYSNINMWPESIQGPCAALSCKLEERCVVGRKGLPVCVTSSSFAVSYQLDFVIIEEKMSFQQAVEECAKLNGRLAVVDTLIKHNKIKELLKDLSGFAWLGASDADEEGVWVWVDGEKMSFQRWSSGQPDNHGNDQHCMVISANSATWYDRACTSTYMSVCETVILI